MCTQAAGHLEHVGCRPNKEGQETTAWQPAPLVAGTMHAHDKRCSSQAVWVQLEGTCCLDQAAAASHSVSPMNIVAAGCITFAPVGRKA